MQVRKPDSDPFDPLCRFALNAPGSPFASAPKAAPDSWWPTAQESRILCSMKITEDVRNYAAEQGIAEEEVLKKGMAEKSRKFTEKRSELYAKA